MEADSSQQLADLSTVEESPVEQSGDVSMEDGLESQVEANPVAVIPIIPNIPNIPIYPFATSPRLITKSSVEFKTTSNRNHNNGNYLKGCKW